MTSFGRFFMSVPMILARDYASCHAARSALVKLAANNVQTLRWPAKRLDLNPIDKLLQGTYTAPVTKSQGAHARYSLGTSRCMRLFHNGIFIETF